MGRLTHRLVQRLPLVGLALALAAAIGALEADAVAAFDGFGAPAADSTYGEGIRFEVELDGGTPDRLQLLLRFPGSDAALVVPVTPAGGRADYTWDVALDHVTPNTVVTYQWRAITGREVTLSEPGTLRYEDDRPGLDWRSERLGDATVHWYGGAEAQALRFGELTAQGVARAEELLGTRLAGPVDVFVYATRDDFFGALGPGAREWTGAAAYTDLRTIFMWLEGGSTSYLETAMLHEVTHIVFADATDNPFHEPARWLNEGIATWSEDGSVDEERGIVELEANGGGLFAFEAIAEQFPIGERGGRLSYAQGTMLIDRIVDEHGEGAIAEIAAAYRGGASDAEALEAATGEAAEDLYAAFFAEYGVEPPQPITPDPILPSNVDRPAAGPVDPGGVDTGNPGERPPDDGAPVEPGGEGGATDLALVALLVVAVAAVLGGAVLVARRAGSAGSS